MRLHTLELNPVGIDSFICTRTWFLQSNRESAAALNGYVPQLNVPDKCHSIWSPIFEVVRNHIDIHERAPGLSYSKLSNFTISLAKMKRCLSCIWSRPK